MPYFKTFDISSITDLSNVFSGISDANWMNNIATIDSAPIHHDIIYIHKTNCPNCGGLLDGDEHNPYVHCQCCGAKVWSEREVS